jgi:hypothetical protein
MHPIYRAEFLGTVANHQTIFVELDNATGAGNTYHVKGTIQNGMNYEIRPDGKPELAAEFVGKLHLGWVANADVAQIDSVCAAIPPPKKQFDGRKRLSPGEPLRRCGGWLKEAALALQSLGVIQGALASQVIADMPVGDYWTWVEERQAHYHRREDGTLEKSNSSIAMAPPEGCKALLE